MQEKLLTKVANKLNRIHRLSKKIFDEMSVSEHFPFNIYTYLITLLHTRYKVKEQQSIYIRQSKNLGRHKAATCPSKSIFRIKNRVLIGTLNTRNEVTSTLQSIPGANQHQQDSTPMQKQQHT